MRTPIPPDVAQPGGFYDDEEENDRNAARLIKDALGETVVSFEITIGQPPISIAPLEPDVAFEIGAAALDKNRQFPDETHPDLN